MALTYGFYNSVDHDRQYSAEDFGDIFNGIINDGVFMNIGDHFSIYPSSELTVAVAPGRAWFNGTWTENDNNYLVTIEEPEVLQSRIDVIALEIDKRNDYRRNRIVVLKGVPAATPSRPGLTQTGGLYQYALGYVTIKPTTTAISASDITQVVGMSETPFVTGILQIAQLNSLYQNWEKQFNDWFYDIQVQMGDNVALNLQSQINQLKLDKVNVSDKATSNDIKNGTSNKWVDAASIHTKLSPIEYKIGDVKWSAKELSLPWVKCNGQLLNRSTYSDLYSVVSDKYGIAYNLIDAVKAPFSTSSSAVTAPQLNLGLDQVFATPDHNTVYVRTSTTTSYILNRIYNLTSGSYVASVNSYTSLSPNFFVIGNDLYEFRHVQSGSGTSVIYTTYIYKNGTQFYSGTSNYNNPFGLYINMPIVTEKAAYILLFLNGSDYVMKINSSGVNLLALTNMPFSLRNQGVNRYTLYPGKTRIFMTYYQTNDTSNTPQTGYINLETGVYYSKNDSVLKQIYNDYGPNKPSSNDLVYGDSSGYYFYSFSTGHSNYPYRWFAKIGEDSSGNAYFKLYSVSKEINANIQYYTLVCADEFDNPWCMEVASNSYNYPLSNSNLSTIVKIFDIYTTINDRVEKRDQAFFIRTPAFTGSGSFTNQLIYNVDLPISTSRTLNLRPNKIPAMSSTYSITYNSSANNYTTNINLIINLMQKDSTYFRVPELTSKLDLSAYIKAKED